MDKNAISKADALKKPAIEAEKLGADEADGTKLDLGAKLENLGAEKGDRIQLDKGSIYECSADGKDWIKFKPSDEGYVDLSTLASSLKVEPPELIIRIDRSKIFYSREISYATSATVDNIIINGLATYAINPRSFFIRIVKADTFVGISPGDNVSSWFKNMPAGLTAKLTSVNIGGPKVNITISGTPSSRVIDAMQIVIPGSALQLGRAVTVQHNPNAMFSIDIVN